MKSVRGRIALVVGVALVLSACAGQPEEPEEPLEEKLRRVGNATPGLGPGSAVMAVDAEDENASWMLVAKARGEGPSLDSRMLAQALSQGATAHVRIVVGGPYGGLTRQVVLDAFDLVKEPELPYLTLLFVGPARQARDVKPVVEAVRARFHHAELPE